MSAENSPISHLDESEKDSSVQMSLKEMVDDIPQKLQRMDSGKEQPANQINFSESVKQTRSRSFSEESASLEASPLQRPRKRSFSDEEELPPTEPKSQPDEDKKRKRSRSFSDLLVSFKHFIDNSQNSYSQELNMGDDPYRFSYQDFRSRRQHILQKST